MSAQVNNKMPLTMVDAGERVGALNQRAFATVILALIPLLSALAAAVAAHVIGGAQDDSVAHVVAMSLGWLVGAIVAIRYLRRRWSNRSCPSAAYCLLAAAVSFLSVIGVVAATAPWHDLMSQPRPTLLMVLKDVTATFAPLVAALFAPWYVLSRRT